MTEREDETLVSTAVIVAAGKGSRLGGDEPKPLRKLVGVPLIKRVMHGAAKAGVREFIIVVGYRADIMKERLPGLVPTGCGLTVVENPRYEEPNGVSLRLGLEAAGPGPVALLMSDHVFTPDRLREACRGFRHDPAPTLAVEDWKDFTGDLGDATLVRTEGGRVTRIGKELIRYDAVDTGMFILPPSEIIDALDEAGPAPSITDGMKVLAGAGRLRALRVGSGWWRDVDTDADFRAAEKALYRGLIKPTDGFLARVINRRVSLALSTRLWKAGVSPNTITVLTLLFGLASGAAFAAGGGVGWGLLGAALFQFQSILDGVDGEIARLTLKESRAGFWLDVACDNLTHMAVFGGIAAGRINAGEPGLWAVLGVMAVIGVAVSFALTTPLLSPGGGADRLKGGGALKRVLDGAARRDFTWLLFPVVVLGLLGWFLWLATVGTWIFALAVAALRIREGAGR